MAKLAVINRQAKREAMVKKYAERRKQLLAIIRDPKATDDARDEARAKLQALPRDASPVRLRNRRMYEFLDRLVTIALPRVRDFRGISGRAFDSRGNYNMGVKEQIIFPEIEYDKVDALRGMNISITTTAKSDEEARALLAAFKFPFRTERAA